MIRWFFYLIKKVFRSNSNQSECPNWDGYNECCMWERIEKIFPEVWEKENVLYRDCMEEMP